MLKNALVVSLCCIGLLSACSHQPNSQVQERPESAAPIVEQPFKAETLFALMVAELAANRQEFDLTLGNYLEQAHKTRDLGVIARATRIAQFLDVRQAAFDMGLLWLSVEPESAEANLVVAQELLRQNRPLDAMANIEKVLAKQENPILENVAVQAASFDQETKDTLIKRITSLQKRYPNYASIPVSLAIIYQQQKQNSLAIKATKQALRINKGYAPAIINRARQLHDQQSPEAAATYLEKQVEKNPNNSQLRLMYARLLTKTDTQAAYDQFNTLSAQTPNQPDIIFSQALIAFELGKYKEAQKLLSRLNSIQYRNDILPFYLGLTEERLDNKDAAIEAYLSTIPGEEYINAQTRVFFLWVEQGELARAQTYFNKLRKQYPAQAQTLYTNQAQSLLTLKQYDAAKAILDEAITAYPDEVNLLYSRAMVFEKMDQLEPMEQDFRRALSIKPDHTSSLNALGYILADRTERYTEALALIEQAHTQKPEDPAILDSLGWVHFKMGNYPLAIKYLEKAYQTMKDPEVASHLGEALWVTNQRKKAHEVWNDFADDPKVIDTIKRLDGS